MTSASVPRPALALPGADLLRAAMEFAGHKLAKSGTTPPAEGQPVANFRGRGTDGGSVAILREHRRSSPGNDAFVAGVVVSNHDRPGPLIGWSLGGFDARGLGKPMAPCVRQVITLRTPSHADAKRQPTRSASRWAALCIAALALGGCDGPASDPPMPPRDPVRVDVAPVTGSTSGPSVPAADTVLLPGAATNPDPTAARSNAGLSKAQESSAMPLPGQNNDHSAPLTPPKGASSP